jgi:hypothetical protein
MILHVVAIEQWAERTTHRDVLSQKAGMQYEAGRGRDAWEARALDRREWRLSGAHFTAIPD